MATPNGNNTANIGFELGSTALLGLPFALALLFYLFSLVMGKRR